VVQHLLPVYVKLPTTEEAEVLAAKCFAKYKFPQSYAAVDGSHIPITPSLDGCEDFKNRKGYYYFKYNIYFDKYS
jgi:hypothetical protein